MNYIIAKKLRDNGYECKKKFLYFTDPEYKGTVVNKEYHEHSLYGPDTNELLRDAFDEEVGLLGGFFNRKTGKSDMWCAVCLRGENAYHDASFRGFGDTPDEALADLWIKRKNDEFGLAVE